MGLEIYKLGSCKEYTVFEAELVGIFLSIHAIAQQETVSNATIALDNRAAILVCTSHQPQPAHRIVRMIRDQLEQLCSMRPELNITLIWVLGHSDIDGNKKADLTAKPFNA